MLHLRPAAPATTAGSTGIQTVGDRFWAWGHPPGSHNKDYNLPGQSTIAPADGALSLGIRNLFMVRFGAEPKSPYDELALSLRPMKRVAWSLVGAGGRTSPEEREEVIALARRHPNVTGFLFDDFWSGGPPSTQNGIVLTLNEMDWLRSTARGDFWSVCYVSELFRPEIIPYLRYFDRHTLWTWDPYHLRTIADKLDRFESMVPNSPRYMGVYLWDYGRCAPVPLPLLELQCQEGLARMRAGNLEGMVFLATCIADLDIRAVEWVRRWIAEVRDIQLS